jgi:hypothetical protein
MTTRAGAAGLLTGLITTVIIEFFFLTSPTEFLRGWPGISAAHFWAADALTVLMLAAGGFVAARRSGAGSAWHRSALGALAGGLAGTVVYCLWGAAAAGASAGVDFDGQIAATGIRFLWLFSGGALFGALGGRLACRRLPQKEIVINRDDPQMAMNAFITALPASVFAAVLAAAFFPRFAALNLNRTEVEMPLLTALLLVVVTHFVLMMVVPHEARMADHRCGTDEVKMAAFVSIASAPVLALLLLLVYPAAFRDPWVDAALLACLVMSLKSSRDLVKVVLPKRASFKEPEGGEKQQALLFGSIAGSRAPRLVVLCMGCGLAMVLPLYVCVVSPMVNLRFITGAHENLVSIFLQQAAVSIGMAAAAVLALIFIYMIYLNLGRWSSKRKTG